MHPTEIRYAVHAGDLATAGLPVLLLLRPHILQSAVVTVEPQAFASLGVVLNCPSEQAEAIIAILRQHYRPHEFRCYRLTGKRSQRI